MFMILLAPQPFVPSVGAMLVKREDYLASIVNLKNKACGKYGRKIYGRFD
jgi:hypothetical protein